MRKTQTVRYIKPETICINDTIRVTWKWRDTEKSVVGKVASRQVHNHSTEYLTGEGETLLEQFRFKQQKITVTLIDRPADYMEPLFDFNDINEVI